MPLAIFILLVQLMDNFRVFEPIIGFNAARQRHVSELSHLHGAQQSERPDVFVRRRHVGPHHPGGRHPGDAGADPHIARIWNEPMSGSAQRRSWPLAVGSMVFVLLWLFIAAFPYVWTAWGSFKVQADFFSRETWWNAIFGVRTLEQTGSPFTGDGYYGAWVASKFWKSVINTAIVTVSVTAISLTLGTFGGYALARSTHRYKFWILIAALVFRAMPDITLVSGYLLPFFQLNIWGYLATTIVVLVAINQPFSLWMLYSFFVNIPKELDESALGRWLLALPGVPPRHHAGDVAGRRHHGPLQFPPGLQRFRGHLHAADPGEPDHGAEDLELPVQDPVGGQCDVRRGGGRFRHGSAVFSRHLFPEAAGRRPDGGRREGMRSANGPLVKAPHELTVAEAGIALRKAR